jgi:murein DD-endopeptidase MepM/ murein hydrolase activator NlpD
VAGEISQRFGCSDYYSGIPGPGCPADAPWFHDGLDVAAPVGVPVQAAITGTVIFAGPDGAGPLCNQGYRGYGLGVVVDNGQGWQTLYAHLSEIYVQAGEAVTAETVIGLVGATGCASGPHLHFGLRYRDTLVDPLAVKGE